MAKRARKGSTGTDVEKLIERLELLVEAVREQAKASPEFAARVEAAINPAAIQSAAPRRPKTEAALDPFAAYETGWESMLRQSLKRLSASQLADVIEVYRLDPSDKVSGEKSREKLCEWIVAAVMNRAKQS